MGRYCYSGGEAVIHTFIICKSFGNMMVLVDASAVFMIMLPGGTVISRLLVRRVVTACFANHLPPRDHVWTGNDKLRLLSARKFVLSKVRAFYWLFRSNPLRFYILWDHCFNPIWIRTTYSIMHCFLMHITQMKRLCISWLFNFYLNTNSTFNYIPIN